MNFNTINHLLFEKKKTQLDVDLLENFSPYLTARSLTMLCPTVDMIQYTNDTLNTYYNLFEFKEDQFRFFESIIPKSKKRRYTYIKKIKNEDKKELKMIPEFYSRREIDKLNNVFK